MNGREHGAIAVAAGTEADDLRSYVAPILLRKWLVLAMVLVVPIATYVYFDRQPRSYEAATKVFVGQSQALTAAGSVVSPVAAERNLGNQATLLTTLTVARDVAARISFQGALSVLAGSVTAAPDDASDFITIGATSATPQLAAEIANGFADAFRRQRSDDERESLQDALSSREAQLRSFPPGDANAIERASVASTVRQLRLALSLETGGVQQLDPAIPPAMATSPRPRRNALFAAVLALLSAVALALGLERFDRRLKSVTDVESAFGLPVLAILPEAESAVTFRSAAGNALAQPFVEPMRALRTNIGLQALDKPVTCLLVTSALPSEGKSAVARNLAIAMHENGLRVAVVDADLRRPQINRAFGIDTAVPRGLTSVLTGDLRLTEALAHPEVDTPGRRTIERLNPTIDRGDDGHRVAVLGPGPAAANPQAVLAAEQTGVLIEELKSEYDIVIIDSPPLLAVSDSLSLLPYVDGVLLVSRLEMATRDTSRRLRELLARVGGPELLGVVVNGVRGVRGDGYAYSYTERAGQLPEPSPQRA